MVFCTYCGQEFSRAEHLDRHVLTHSNIKPFKCATCHFSFKRRDLLQRHYQFVHKDADDASAEMEEDTPQRRAIACTLCARAKTKCDKAIPSCSRCLSKGLPCQSRSTRRASDTVYRQAKKQLNLYRRTADDGVPTIREQGQKVQAHQNLSLENKDKRTSDPMMMHYVLPSSGVGAPDVMSLDPPNMPVSTPTGDYNYFALQSMDPLIAHQMTSQPSQHGIPTDASSFSTPTYSMGTVKSEQYLDGVQLQCTNYPGNNGDNFFPMIASSSDPGIDGLFSPYDHSPMQLQLPQEDMSHIIAPDLALYGLLNAQEIQTPLRPDDTSSETIAMYGTIPSPQSLSDQSKTYTPVTSPHGLNPVQIPFAPNADFAVYGQGPDLMIDDAWPCFQCNPHSEPLSTYNKTARIYLDELERTLKDPNAWHAWHSQSLFGNMDGVISMVPAIEPVGQRTRDKLMVITQNFLHKAHEIQGLQAPKQSNKSRGRSFVDASQVDFDDEAFLTLPTSEIIDQFLEGYCRRFETYYPMISTATFSPTGTLHSGNKKPASILLLLMIAAGAAYVPQREAHCLAGGLTETCRLLLFDLIDKDILLSRDPLVLRAILLFVNLAAWSGDRWLMDFATGQSSTYISVRIACPTTWTSLGLADGPQMLRHSGLMAYRNLELPECDRDNSLNSVFQQWRDYESLNRLVYSWVIVDQELSLFHDTPPNMSVTELTAALPESDLLWQARDADEWTAAIGRVHGNIAPHELESLPSLYSLFKRLMNRQISKDDTALTPLQLRLLLHPLQALICHLHQCLSCLASGTTRRQAQQLLTQLEEAQALLQHWYSLFSRTMREMQGFSPVMCTNLVVYHLVTLNTMLHFPDIEKLARGEIRPDNFLQTSWAQVRFVEEAQHIWFHCGQIIRLYRQMPVANQPHWWPAAIYRVTLIMWVACISNAAKQDHASHGTIQPLAGPTFALDNLEPDHPSIVRYLKRNEGTPVLSKRNGSIVSLDIPLDMLMHGLDVLQEEESALRVGHGIRNRLVRLVQRLQL